MSTVTIALCPRCQAPRPMALTQADQTRTNAEGQTYTVVIESYHCTTCHTFVSSTERPQDPLALPASE